MEQYSCNLNNIHQSTMRLKYYILEQKRLNQKS